MASSVGRLISEVLAEGLVGAQTVRAQHATQCDDIAEVGRRSVHRGMARVHLGLGFGLREQVHVGVVGVGQQRVHVEGGRARLARPRRVVLAAAGAGAGAGTRSGAAGRRARNGARDWSRNGGQWVEEAARGGHGDWGYRAWAG